jgi:hypothetical protein
MDYVESPPDDEDLEVAMLTSNREAFTGFWNLAATPPPPRWQTPPWQVQRPTR